MYRYFYPLFLISHTHSTHSISFPLHFTSSKRKGFVLGVRPGNISMLSFYFYSVPLVKYDHCDCHGMVKIDPFYKFHNVSDIYPTMHHFVPEKLQTCAHFCNKWCVVGYGTGALWDLCDRSIVHRCARASNSDSGRIYSISKMKLNFQQSKASIKVKMSINIYIYICVCVCVCIYRSALDINSKLVRLGDRL